MRYVKNKTCAVCARERAKAFGMANAELVKAKQAAYYAANSKKFKEYAKEYHRTHPLTAEQRARRNARAREWCRENPDKVRAKNKKHKRNPEQTRRHNLQQLGTTPEEWAARYTELGGLCALCRSRKIVATDHCHSLGVFRDLLCNPCNTGLGKFKDDPALLRRAATYVESKGFARAQNATLAIVA